MKTGSMIHAVWGWYSDTIYVCMWVWRPYCWLRRHHDDDSYGYCVTCRKKLAPPPLTPPPAAGRG